MKLKNTKANVLELLRKMYDTDCTLWKYAKDEGNTLRQEYYGTSMITLDMVINLFNDADFFAKMADIYVEEEEDN